MKILITSDIHSNLDVLNKLIKKHPNIDYHLDAGDSELTLNQLEQLNIISVRGNTDVDFNLKIDHIMNVMNQKILLIHGHTQGVKNSLIGLSETAKNLEVDIVIFGHTHIPFNKKIGNILYLNPGSLGYDKSYIIIDNKKVRFHTL